MSRKLFPVSVVASAVALSLAGGDVAALGLGGLRVQSALNQPFVAEIDLLDVKPDELDTVKAQLAPSQEFSKVGAERFHYLTKLKFSPQISPRGDTVIRVTSREPFREPYLDFLVEAIWPQGRLVREYTVLLDPPVTAAQRAPQVAPPVASTRRPVRSESPPERVAPARPKRSAPPPPAPPPMAAPVAYESGYPLRIGPVRPGTGLWRLAVRNTPGGATVAQTAMALYRNNQGAFIKGDINRLLVGRTLVIPSSAELLALGPEAAQREFEAALRGEKVRRAPIAPAAPAVAAEDARLKIAGAAGTDTTTAPASEVAAAQGPEANREMAQELLLVREASESARQETGELRTRIRELEQQLVEIQKLLQLRNAELARIQGGEGELPETAEPTVAEPAPLPPELEAAIAAAEATVSDVSAGESVISEPLPLPDEGSALPDLETAIDVAEPEVARIEPGEQAAAESAVGEASAVEPAQPKTPEKSSEVAVGEEYAEAGFPWQAVLLPVAGLAGLGALGVGVFAWLRTRRRRSDYESELETSGFVTDAPFGSTLPTSGPPQARDSQDLGSGVDGPSSSLVDLSRTETATDEADAISEADIYIAYGRYREAEELLTEEIGHSPDRLDLKFKLAEAYVGARKHADLGALLDQMRASGADRANPDQWQRLVEMAGRATGGESLDAAPSATPDAAVGLGETRDVASREALSLDISDGGKPSLDLDSELAFEPEMDLGSASDREASGYSAPASLSAQPSGSAPGELDLELEVGSEELSSPLDLGIDTELLEPIQVFAPDDTGGGRHSTEFSASETDLDLGGAPGVSEFNLDGLLDSGNADTMEMESLLSPDNAPAGRGGGVNLRPVATTGVTRTPMTDLPVTGIEAETPSSDLLSSQWQVDSGLWDETATKLDLARAYVEMGDSDSARGMLEEVVAEGNEEQRTDARSLLDKIA